MFRQRQHNSIAEMMIQRDQGSLLLHGPLQNQRVIRARLAHLGSADDIMTRRTQKRREVNAKHLVEVKAHGGLDHTGGDEFCMQDGLPGVPKGSLNIGLRQLRIASEQGIPRITPGQLFQDSRHRNSRPLDDRLAATNTRIDFNAFAHPLNHNRTA